MWNEIPLNEIKDIHWKAQDSDSESLLFYRVTAESEAEGKFVERIKSAKYRWLVINRPASQKLENCSVIDESKWIELQKQILDRLYPMPPLKLLALTGTNGKTTTTDLVLQLASLAGKKGISIGTLGVRENHKTLLDFGMTSPGYIDLRKFLNRYGTGKDFCVMEASSHALIQDRLHGLEFDGAGWLSFSQDHLDYHKTMEAYFAAKSLLFKQLKNDSKCFVPAEQKDLLKQLAGVSKKVNPAPELNSEHLPLFFKTRFNQNNLEVAKAMVESVFGIELHVDYNQILPPDGRFYIKPYKSNFIVVDFAHTPDALINICQGIKATFPGFKLKVLFGCGGDRDRTKRPLMAKVVDEWAEEIYVTSDNPRSEDPQQIIDDIVKGITRHQYKMIVERPAAVKQAFAELKEKEVLLLAGKGHEDYILINGVKHPYSDIREVDEFISRNSK